MRPPGVCLLACLQVLMTLVVTVATAPLVDLISPLAHLGKRVVLLERKQLTCGTTWHSAGHVGYLRPSLSLSRLAKYSGDLYQRHCHGND